MAINLKNLKNFKQGVKQLTPKQLCINRIAGLVGMLVGLIYACITTIIARSWGWAIFTLFLTWFQFVSLVGEIKQYLNFDEVEKQLEVLKKDVKENLEDDGGLIK